MSLYEIITSMMVSDAFAALVYRKAAIGEDLSALYTWRFYNISGQATAGVKIAVYFILFRYNIHVIT